MFDRYMKFVYAVSAVLCLVYLGCTVKANTPSNRKEEVRSYYIGKINALDSALSILQRTDEDADIQKQFLKARLAYKEVEVFAEYYTAGTARALNGAAREEVSVEEPNGPPEKPLGFQVVEQYLFPTVQKEHRAEYLSYIKDMRQYMNNLRIIAKVSPFTDSHIFDAVRVELFRVIMLGISGSDCAITRNAIPEAEAALHSCAAIMNFYSAESPKAKSLSSQIDATAKYCAAHSDFTTFDRAEFIVSYINPACESLALVRNELHIIPGQDRRLLSASAKTIFSESDYDPTVYGPQYNQQTSPAKIELGKMLFFEPLMSANGKRACASCHAPNLAFTDGNDKSIAFEFEGKVDRNAPTILNAALQREYFFDGRAAYLEDQITAVVTSHKEFRCSYSQISKKLSASQEYKRLFATAFGQDTTTITGEQIRAAVACYVRSLVSMKSPFDKYMRGEKNQLTEQQIHGFNLFMGKAQCATCHFMPLFNGTVPPRYEESEWEVLGVPSRADTVNITLDSDPGRFNVSKSHEIERFGFKTPTLRNIALTGPYMHNGAYKTLDEVMDFYNHGGGAGLGLTVPNQTLSPEKLNLTKEEIKDVIAFLHSLTDSTFITTPPPSRLPKFETASLATRKIGGVY